MKNTSNECYQIYYEDKCYGEIKCSANNVNRRAFSKLLRENKDIPISTDITFAIKKMNSNDYHYFIGRKEPLPELPEINVDKSSIENL
jgi:hypothetical protein